MARGIVDAGGDSDIGFRKRACLYEGLEGDFRDSTVYQMARGHLMELNPKKMAILRESRRGKHGLFVPVLVEKGRERGCFVSVLVHLNASSKRQLGGSHTHGVADFVPD